MKIKSVTCEYISKPLKELQIGDRVLGVNGDRPKILNIQKNGVQPTFTIKLSDGRSFRAGKGHFNTVHFRNSKLRPDKKVYDVLTVEYIKDHLNEYLFEIPTDDTFNLDEIDFWQHLEMLPCHENEPADKEDIIPDFNRDPNKVYIESITPDEDEECWCLQLNDPLGLFAIEDRIFTHNSLLSNLIVAYTILQFCFMREPYKVLGHSAMTSYCIALAAYSLNKVWDLLGTPLEQFIEQSPIFEKVPHREDVVNADKLDPGCNKIIYSTAGRGSARMLFRNNLQLKMMSTEGHLLGNTIIAAVFTELAWWEQNGWTKEQIKRFFDKACQRVDSRMGGHFLGRYIIDSSPFSLESPIDKWIWEEAVYDPKWYCVLGAKWDYFKNEFPGFFDKNGEEIHNWDVGFQCYKGGKNEPPKCLKSEVEAQLYDPLDLVWCPRLDVTAKGTTQLMSLAMQNPIEFLRDWAGIPAGSSDRIFQAGAVVENIFDNDLKNIYTSIVADAAYEPKDLIWNQIKDKLFINFNGNYMFYREPHAKRVLSVDQSLTGDATGLSVCHWEFEKEKDGVTTHNVCVVDFTLAIIPKGGRINLDAIKDFIMALIEYAGMNIAYVNFDTFQSESTKQYLKRKKIPIEYISVDKDNGPYQTLIDYITHERLMCGKNLFFKNNLRSLHWSKRDSGSVKIDHFKGKIVNESANVDWQDSPLGVNAKDVSDTVAACIAMLTKYDVELAPSTEWRNTKLLGPKSVNETLKKYGFKI